MEPGGAAARGSAYVRFEPIMTGQGDVVFYSAIPGVIVLPGTAHANPRHYSNQV